MSGTERPTDREEDYRFLHSMLMEKKLHLLFKIHERLRRFEKRDLLPAGERAAGLASDLAEELTRQSWSGEARELAALISEPHFKGLLCVHDAVAQRAFEPTLPPVPEHVLEEEEDSVKIVSLVKTKEPLDHLLRSALFRAIAASGKFLDRVTQSTKPDGSIQVCCFPEELIVAAKMRFSPWVKRLLNIMEGATIKRDRSTGAIVVARIMRGGPADKSGLIHEGDELREVNGVSLEHRKPKEIPSLLARSQREVRFTIIPAFSQEETPPNKPKLFVRALFDYDPGQDPAVPCKDAAVAFRWGDVLQIVSAEDDAWWQACHQRDGQARAGLVPSAQLQQRRVALQRPKVLFRAGRVRAPDEKEACPAVEDVDYGAITGIHIAGFRRSFRLGKKSSWVRQAAGSKRWSAGVNGSNPPPAYREVIPYRRDPEDGARLVVLVGPDGVGVNELKRRLLISDPDRYAVSVPYTTRKKRKQESEGVDYHYQFIEYGRYGGHYYGTSVDSVRRVMAEGKVCLLDVHPTKLKRVYSLEFMPYVVFVKPPRLEELRLTRRRAKFVCDGEDAATIRTFSEEDFENMIDLAETMENHFGHLFDKVIVNGDVTTAFRELKADLQRVERDPVQWVPPEWVCLSPTGTRRSCGQLGGWI